MQAGRHFNQARYDAHNKRRWEHCVAQKKAEEEAELLRTDVMEQLREEFLVSSDKRCRRARLRYAVNAQLQLHQFALKDRRDRYCDTSRRAKTYAGRVGALLINPNRPRSRSDRPH